MVHHHHALKGRRGPQQERGSRKIFILSTIISFVLFVHLSNKCVLAASKSKEKSTKTTVIAISGQAGKPHPVPVPWPVVHCHHHHHHLKYVPKPVLVHHWVKKYKPVDIEASNQHYQVLEGPMMQQRHQENSLLASTPHTRFQMPLRPSQNDFRNEPTMGAPLAGRQLLPISLFSQADQSKLPYDLMDGSQLVSALSNAFDPLVHSLPKPPSSASPLMGEPQRATLVLQNQRQPQQGSTAKFDLFDNEQQAPSYKLLDNQTAPSSGSHEIDKEFIKFEQQHRKQQKRFRSAFDAGARAQAGSGTSGGAKSTPLFTDKQLEKLTRSIKSAQKQLKPVAPFDTEPFDSLKNNVVAADIPQPVRDDDMDQQQQQQQQQQQEQTSAASSASSTGATALADLSASTAGKPSHPFDEPHDQLRDETRSENDRNMVVASRFDSNQLDQANMREEAQARRLLDRLSLNRASRLAALSGLSSQQTFPFPSNQHAGSLSSKLQLIRPPFIVQQQMAGAPNQLIGPAAISARMASVLSESHTINLMTRLAERMAQLEAKNLLDRQLARAKASTKKFGHNVQSASKSSPARTFLGNLDQVRSLLSPLRVSRERRRQSKAKRLVQTSDGQAQWITTGGLQPQASNVKKFVWTTQSNLKPTAAPSVPNGMAALMLPDYHAPASAPTPSVFMDNDVITASPLKPIFMPTLGNSSSAQAHAPLINGRASNPAASSRFINQRVVAGYQQQLAPAGEGLESEASVLVKKIVEPAMAKQQVAKAKVFGHKPNAAEKAIPAVPTATVEPANSTSKPSQPAAQTMSAEQESRFYVGQHEHLEKAKQQEQGAGQASQLSLDLQQAQVQPIQVRQLPIARGTQRQQQPHPVGVENLLNVAGIKATDTNRLYSSQSSNVRQSVMPAAQEQSEPPMPTAEMGAEALRQLESMQADGQRKSSPFRVQPSSGPDATSEQDAQATRADSQELEQHQQQAGGQFQVAEQLASYLEFPMSAEQWSSEAMKSLNAQQQEQAPHTQASHSQDQAGSSQGDEQQISADEEKGNESQEASEAEKSHQQNQAARFQNELASYELMPAHPAATAAYQMMAGQQQDQQMAFPYSSASMAASLEQANWQQPQAANPYGYYTAGHQQEAMSPTSNLMSQLEASFGPYASLLNGQEQSQFTANYNPMTQQPYYRPGPAALSSAGSNMLLSGVQSTSLTPPTMADYNLARFPQISAKSAAELASKMQTKGPINQSASLVTNSFAGPMSNLTGFGGLAGTLGNQMQARLPPQMPQMPNIPQPPQLPNLPMPPPGMLQMAASMALPLAMARATRNSNRFRNNQVNAAASNGGSTSTSAGQRFLRNLSGLTNRLMRPRRRPPTSAPPAARPLSQRRQPFVWGRPNGSGSLGSSQLLSSSAGIEISRRRPPLVRFIQTVVDMSRRPPIQMAANLAGNAALSATKASVASSINANLAGASTSPAASIGSVSSAAGSVANAAASAVVQAASAVAADKIKPKIDTDAALRREGSASRLSRSLERLQHDLRQAGEKGRHAGEPLDMGHRSSASVVMPGLPRIALTDGSLATFGSMTSPVDLLSRQLASQRKVRELSRQPHFHLSAYQEHPLAHQAHYELMRLSALAAGSTPSQMSLVRATQSEPNNDVIAANSLQSLDEPSQTQQPIQQSSRPILIPTPAHHMNVSHPIPFVANHFNLLMFTAQNVTGNLGLKLPAPAQEQQSHENPASSQAQQDSAEQTSPLNREVVSSSDEPTQEQKQQQQQQQQQQLENQLFQHQSADLAQSSDDKLRQQKPGSEIRVAAGEERVQYREETTERPVTEQRAQKTLELHAGPPLFEIAGHGRPRELVTKSDKELIQPQETQVNAKRAKRKKSHPHGYTTTTQAPRLLPTRSLVTTTSTTPTPSTASAAPIKSHWLAGEISDTKSHDSHDIQHLGAESQWNEVSATKLLPIKADKMDPAHAQHSKTRPTTSVRPTRAAVLESDESLGDEERPKLEWKNKKSQLAGEEQEIGKESRIITTKMPEQIEMLTSSRDEVLPSTSVESAKGATTATPATGDYVRAIKLVRGLAYPWPPPTQSAKMLSTVS